MNKLKNLSNSINEKGLMNFCRVVGFDYGLIRPSKKLGDIYWNMKKKENKKYFSKTINGYKMLLYYKDEGLSRELFIKSKREFLATERMKEVIKKNDIVMDIGANIGYYVLLESGLVGHDGLVYAIEPVPFNNHVLTQNIIENRIENVSINSCAMGSKKGKSKIYIDKEMNKCSMSKLKHHSDYVEIDVDTVDNFVKDKTMPTFLRMDVEGFEYEILKGAKKMLREQQIKNIFLELHPPLMEDNDIVALLNLLKKNNFDIDRIYRSDKELFKAKETMQKYTTYLDYSSLSIDMLLSDKTYKKVGCPQIFFKKGT